MPFTSPAFLALLLATLPLYRARPREAWQHLVLLVSSFVFYWFAGVKDLTLLLCVVCGNHLIALLPAKSKARLALAVAANVGTLGYFKYRVFVAELLGVTGATASPIPLGISFYIFQLIAYQVDLYRGRVEREPSVVRLLLYVLFFPHHQAGPIMRPAAFLPQFRGDKPMDWDQLGRGLTWAAYGLFLKVCADRIAEVIDPIYARGPGNLFESWVAALGFAAQIYGDFAGYSSIAIGVGLMLGYQLDRNFNQPYFAFDPSVFWQRWHITLSEWLRDYVYIPLGGNRAGKGRTYLNLLLTMTIGGLWHGASWNFVVWGALHGVLLCIFRAFPIERIINRAAGWLVTQFAVLLLWVLFRASDMTSAWRIWATMFGPTAEPGPSRSWLLLIACLIAFFIVHGLEEALLASTEKRQRTLDWWNRLNPAIRGVALGVGVLISAVILRDGTTFIYFRF